MSAIIVLNPMARELSEQAAHKCMQLRDRICATLYQIVKVGGGKNSVGQTENHFSVQYGPGGSSFWILCHYSMTQKIFVQRNREIKIF